MATVSRLRTMVTSVFQRSPRNDVTTILHGPDSTLRDELIEIMSRQQPR